MLVAIISPGYSFITTRVGVVVLPSSAKPDPGVAAVTFIFVVSNDTNPRLRPFEGCFLALQLLLDQYVSHRFNVLVAIICWL